jgi:hypothetical protein
MIPREDSTFHRKIGLEKGTQEEGACLPKYSNKWEKVVVVSFVVSKAT